MNTGTTNPARHHVGPFVLKISSLLVFFRPLCTFTGKTFRATGRPRLKSKISKLKFFIAMSFNCACPLPTSLTTIPAVSCGENLGQIQKILFQRRQATASPTFADADDVADGAQLLANWTALKAASDATKVVVSPFVESVVIPPGEAITEGGNDNTTINGAEIVVGAANIPVTGMIRSLPAVVLTALKTLNCELVQGLTVFFVNHLGKIIGIETTSGAGDFRGIPIASFFIGDPGGEGLNTHDKTPFRFNLSYGWRDKLTFVTPTDFDALVDL